MEKQGLSPLEAKERLKNYGLNVLPEEKKNRALDIFLSQLQSPLIYILIFAGIVSFLLKEYSNSIIIFLAVIINSVFGFYQEYKAEKTLEALKKIIPQKTKVIREGKLLEIEVSEVVPGDIVKIVHGEKVPADGVLVESYGFSASEAVLTGESKPVKKGLSDPVFKGTIVLTGHGKFKVTKTGVQTEFGKIAQSLITQKEEKTPLQKKLSDLAKTLGILFLVICSFLFVFGVFLGQPILTMFETSVAVAVAAIPEGLVISLTVILTIAMRKILEKKALIRKLIAAETLGTTTVICTDKTGTITEGLMRVVKTETTDENLATLGAVLCNNLHDPEEISLWQWACLPVGRQKHTFDPQKEVESHKKILEIPFSSERKYMLTVHKINNKNIVFIKGAPEVILENVDNGKHGNAKDAKWPENAKNKKIKDEWQRFTSQWGTEGLRVMALAYKEFAGEIPKKDNLTLKDFGSFSLLAVFGFEDPIREGVKEALNLCQLSGIKVKIITGDFRETAEAVARKLGIKVKKEEILDGYELEALRPPELDKRILASKIFARVKPEQKFKIVESLKNQGEVVAVTGDGVNDAPALKKADIGIVVAQGSEVAKETADMVLLDSNFSTIVKAIYEGRVIFENLKKVVIYLLSDSFTEVILILGSLFFSLPLPLLPVQILWVNLFADGLPNLALAYEKEDEDILREPPRKQNEPILDSQAYAVIFIVGVVTDFFLFLIFLWFLKAGFEINFIRSFILAALGIDSLLYVFSCKTFRKNLWQINLLENKKLVFAVIISFILLYSSFYILPLSTLLKIKPLAPWEWGILFLLGIFEIFLIEATKYFYLKRQNRVTM